MRTHKRAEKQQVIGAVIITKAAEEKSPTCTLGRIKITDQHM